MEGKPLRKVIDNLSASVTEFALGNPWVTGKLESAWLKENLIRDPDLAAPFSDEEYQERLQRTREKMAEAGIDLLFVTAPEGMCYLHNYQATWYRANSTSKWPAMAGTAVHVNHDKLIHFDFVDEVILLRRTSVTKERRIYPDEILKNSLDFLIKELKALSWLGGTVGLEYWSYVPNRAISEKVEAAFEAAGCKVVDGSQVVREVRRIKSPQEIKYIEEAARIADIGHQAIVDTLRPGVTELELFGNALSAMLSAGGEMPGINQGFVSGPLVTAHALSSRREVGPNEMMFADLCGVYNRYHANVACSYFIGEPPSDMLRRFEAAQGGYGILKKYAKSGTPIAEVNQRLRDYYKEAKIWNQRMWVGGYELGISFPPDWVGEFVFSVEEEDPNGNFQENMVTNFESVFWTGLIDTVIYENDGARTLSTIGPRLFIVE